MVRGVNEFFSRLTVDLHEEFLHAVEKHPQYPTPGKTWLEIVVEELGEACQAFNDNEPEKGCQELRQTMVTIARKIKQTEEAIEDGQTLQL